MEKKAERLNVLTESNNKNFVHAILNAVTKGYSDNTIVEDVIELVKSNDISQGTLATAPEALRSYAESVMNSLSVIADEIDDIEVQDAQDRVVRRKRLEQNKEDDENENEEGEEEENEEGEEEENEDELNGDDKNVIEEEMKRLDGEVSVIEEKKRRELEEVDEEDEDDEDEDLNYQSSKIASKDNLVISEDWEKSGYRDNEKKIVGLLKLNFNQDMSLYKNENEISLGKSAVGHIKKRVFAYLKNEYPRIKVKLSSKIFKGNIIFEDLKEGKAQIQYEIDKPFGS